jgi:hypothetical protein
VHEFAANLADPDESRIAPKKTLKVGKTESTKPEIGTPGVRRRLWAYLLLGVALISALEWFSYHRRVTV